MTLVVSAITTAAQALLDATVEALELTAAGFAGEAYLSPGLPAFDGQCDFVAVWMSAENLAAVPTIPSTQLYRTGPRIGLVTLNATVGRCLALKGRWGVPTGDDRLANATMHMEDAQAVWNHVGAEIADGLFDGTCKRVTILGLNALTPQGGFAGWNLVVQVQIDG